ncbi:glutathione S-transferase family protein [Rhodobacterales bacterium]|nr:glutathione S-transferase family protein [Rhodobacterales bacterium]
MINELELFYAPRTRATGALVMLEELEAPHTLHVLNLKSEENRTSEFLKINPAGKVPTLRHGEGIITEQVAIYLYLADLFPEKGLAPALDDPRRGPYLRWFVFLASCFEPALVDRAMKNQEAPGSMSPYGSFDLVMETMRAQLSRGPYVLGDEMTAVDVAWALGLRWGMLFGLVPELDEFKSLVDRYFQRPAPIRILEDDERLANEQDEAAAEASTA